MAIKIRGSPALEAAIWIADAPDDWRAREDSNL